MRPARSASELSQAGLLNEWEEGFIGQLIRQPNQARLSPRQASTLYHLWLERQRRTESDGVAVSPVIKALKAIWLDLDDDERSLLEELACAKRRRVDWPKRAVRPTKSWRSPATRA